MFPPGVWNLQHETRSPVRLCDMQKKKKFSLKKAIARGQVLIRQETNVEKK